MFCRETVLFVCRVKLGLGVWLVAHPSLLGIVVDGVLPFLRQNALELCPPMVHARQYNARVH